MTDVPHDPRCLSIWSLVGGTVYSVRELEVMQLRSHPLPVQALFHACVQDVNSQLPILLPLCLLPRSCSAIMDV